MVKTPPTPGDVDRGANAPRVRKSPVMPCHAPIRPADEVILEAIEKTRARGLPVAYAVWSSLREEQRRLIDVRLLELGCEQVTALLPPEARFSLFVADCRYGVPLPGSEMNLLRDGIAAAKSHDPTTINAVWAAAPIGQIHQTNAILDRLGIEAPAGPFGRFRAYCLRVAGMTPSLQFRRDREQWAAVSNLQPGSLPGSLDLYAR